MISDNSLIDALASLPQSPPDPRRANAIRTKCHQELARRADRLAKTARRKRLLDWCFDAAAGLGVCAYLVVVLQAAIWRALGG